MLEFISIMRAIAVILVVGYHLGLPGFANGYLGVDMFLVIAGFFVGEAFFNKGYTFVYFVDRRVRRLLPELLFWGLVFLLLYSIFARNGDAFNAYVDFVSSVFFFSNMYYETFIGYFEENSSRLLFLHTWSLSLEVQFYIIFALGYVLLLKYLPPKSVFFLIILGFVSSLILNEWAFIYAPSPAFYYLPTRLWEFLVGVAIAFVSFYRAKEPNIPWAPIGSVLLLSSAILVTDGTLKNMVTVILSGCGLVFAIFTVKHAIFRSAYMSPIISIGEKSYSVYLIHWPLIKVFEAAGYPIESSIFILFLFILICATQFSDKYISQQFNKPTNSIG